MEDLTPQEVEVMKVYGRITGCFGSTPKPDTSRGYDGIWQSLRAYDAEMSLDDIAVAIKGLEAKGFLRLDEDKGVAHLTDAGYKHITS